MKLIVFGATGKSGQQIVEQALNAGHLVSAFARNPAAIAIKHPNLKVIEGDALDGAKVFEAIAGHDAVLFAIGINRRSTMNVCTEAARHIIAAMKEHGVRRNLRLLRTRIFRSGIVELRYAPGRASA